MHLIPARGPRQEHRLSLALAGAGARFPGALGPSQPPASIQSVGQSRGLITPRDPSALDEPSGWGLGPAKQPYCSRGRKRDGPKEAQVLTLKPASVSPSKAKGPGDREIAPVVWVAPYHPNQGSL